VPLVKANRRLIGLKYPKPETVRRGTLHLGQERCADPAALVARMNISRKDVKLGQPPEIARRCLSDLHGSEQHIAVPAKLYQND
jgi:hypothetical protein